MACYNLATYLLEYRNIMHIHILGICGTFMANVAILARSMGHVVSGSDSGVYPPMSDLVRDQGITVMEDYHPESWTGARPDLVLVGNSISRGNPSLEYVLDHKLPFNSGAQWLAENILPGRRVLAVAGTHGKTTTTAMLTWILRQHGLEPGYLVGGLVSGSRQTTALGRGQFFVIEADEYDTAFNDKRSKFVHYCPEILVCNSIEFDHADIFSSVEDIYRQFHHLVRTMPKNSTIITDNANSGMEKVLEMGCWSRLCRTGAGSDWQIQSTDPAWRSFEIKSVRHGSATVSWQLIGQHNAQNALAAIVAASIAGVPLAACCKAICDYTPVSRRLEVIYDDNGILVYSDFAHHPTAIKSTLYSLRQAFPGRRLIAVLEPASYTMRNDCHGRWAPATLADCDQVFVYRTEGADTTGSFEHGTVYHDIDNLQRELMATTRDNDLVVLMSNSSFAGLLQKPAAEPGSKVRSSRFRAGSCGMRIPIFPLERGAVPGRHLGIAGF